METVKQEKLALNVEEVIDSVNEFKFEPIKGYPMLNWKGKRPFYSTLYYPAQLKETYGEPLNGWMNKIFWGDNLQVMSHLLKEYRGKIDLVYIDPPFDSKADYKKKISLKGNQITNDRTSFEEKQYTDIWTNDEYLQFMYERLILIRELLAEKGNLVLHCDNKKVHQIRCILDEIFGSTNFKNEIIWHYEKWTSPSSNSFQKNHDNLLFYSKSSSSQFNVEWEITDNLKEKYEKGYLLGGGGGSKGLVVYDPENPKVKEMIASGKYEVVYANTEGKPVSDVWKIPFINPVANERTNYPTQKPEKLLSRIIKTLSNEGDIVFDCFMGSGTTQAVALHLGRKFIGADINLGAIQTTTKRLLKQSREIQSKLQDKVHYTAFEVYNVNNYDVFKNPVEAKELLIKALEVQPLLNNSLYDGEKDGRMVKIMPVNRIATRVDLNELITGFDYKVFEKRNSESPGKPVEFITLICMGHEPDLAAHLKEQLKISGFTIDVTVVDILKDNSNLEFKRDSEAEIIIEKDVLNIKQFYPMNLLQKLSILRENVEDWKELVESIMIDYNYNGEVLSPQVIDMPEGNDLVKGIYNIPTDAKTIRVKIIDLLNESLEVTIHGQNN